MVLDFVGVVLCSGVYQIGELLLFYRIGGMCYWIVLPLSDRDGVLKIRPKVALVDCQSGVLLGFQGSVVAVY